MLEGDAQRQYATLPKIKVDNPVVDLDGDEMTRRVDHLPGTMDVFVWIDTSPPKSGSRVTGSISDGPATCTLLIPMMMHTMPRMPPCSAGPAVQPRCWVAHGVAVHPYMKHH